MLNAIEPVRHIQPHRHLYPPREEVFLVFRNCDAVLLFTDQGSIELILPLFNESLNF